MAEHDRRISRRSFIGGAAAIAAAAGVSSGFPDSMAGALAAPHRSGTLDDVEHVVILMQENRSFDHYYGTMRGVRGFSDRAALRQRNGDSVLYQLDPDRSRGGYLLPFHMSTEKFDSQDMYDLIHDWNSTHEAWAYGDYDNWIAAKSQMTMAYFDYSDIPFHRTLAAAYTICDNYHCSVMGPTIPNRLYLWTGTIDPQGHNGGPATWNPPDYLPAYSWKTYPERLQAAGVSWQVYANDEVGDSGVYPFAGDYGDNPLWLFQAYHDALASSDPTIHELAVRGGLVKEWKPYSGKGLIVDHVIAKFRRACAEGTLPAVSWVVAPYGYSEHPAARPVDGQAYVQGVLDAVWGNQELRESTIVLIDYDENDGFFDHVPPPVPPLGTPEEFLPKSQPIVDGYPKPFGPPTPIGLGVRVPMTVVSPWSRGGWVDSQVFDHTSVLRFLEVWTGVTEPNISAWRRAVCGDLTSCFDFTSTNMTIPALPNTAAMRERANEIDPKLPPPTPPTGKQSRPTQDPGNAPARAIPYQPLANFLTEEEGLRFALSNGGSATVPITLYPQHALEAVSQKNIDVAPGGEADGRVPFDPTTAAYDIWVHGPNGFLAHAVGDAQSNALGVEVTLKLTGAITRPNLRLIVTNSGPSEVTARVTDRNGEVQKLPVSPNGGSASLRYNPILQAHGWYDLNLTLDQSDAYARQYAGHLETGKPSVTG